MAYLDLPRLHFAGRFQAAVSTVNNDPANYPGPVTDPGWNPAGSGAWRLDGCRVTSTRGADGRPAAKTDVATKALVADNGAGISAKLVDLDPDQQLVSQIWGLTVRITTADGQPLVQGAFVPAPLFDLWPRCPTVKGIASLAAVYQSTLEELQWGDTTASPLLAELRRTSPDRLSIKFNVDGFDANPRDKSFTYGRLVGTIGPASTAEPRHFVAGRMLRADGIFAPTTLDEASGRLTVDLGNALATATPGGKPVPPKHGLRLAVRTGGAWEPIGPFDVTKARAYETTAGVYDAVLTADELAAARDGHVGVLDGDAVYLEEDDSRLYVRADELVHRLDPGDEVEVELTVTEAGRPPATRQTVRLALGGGVLGPRRPATGLKVPKSVKTDANGKAVAKLKAGDPRHVRASEGLDGQVYAVSWSVDGAPASAHPDTWDALSVRVFDRYPDVAHPTWHEHVEPIFGEFHKLYPVMANFLDLSSLESVTSQLQMVAMTCNLPLTDPEHMPVTRDLSRAKHAMLARWFDHPVAGPPPPTPPPTKPPAPARAAVASEPDPLTAIKSGRREPKP